MMRPSYYRSPRGPAFSLIELLVVVFIIVVLIAITVPALSYAIDRALQARCLSNIHAQDMAQKQYAFESGRRFAPNDNFSPDYQRSGSRPNIVELMRGTYVPSTKIMICPLTADLPNQQYGEYKRNDWRANGIFGGWDTDADYTNTAYMWLANFSGTRMFEVAPAPPDTSETGLVDVPPGPSRVQMLNGEPPLPMRLSDAEARRSFITHKINFFLSSGSPANLQDAGHGGLGTWQYGDPYEGYQTHEQPVGFGDGHALIRSREQILPRITIGGDYPGNPGTIGTFLW